MARKGTFTAYQGLRPSPLNLNSDKDLDRFLSLQQQEQARQEEDSRRKGSNAALLGKMQSDLRVNPTGIDSKDAINTEAMVAARSQIGDLFRAMENDPSLANDHATWTKIRNLMRSPEDIAMAEATMAEAVQVLQKGMMEGDLSDWNQETMDRFEAYYGMTDPETGRKIQNYKYEYDEMGNLVQKVRTEKGDYDVMVGDINNGLEYSNFVPKADILQSAATTSGQLGKRQRDQVKGGLLKHVQSFEMIEDEATSIVDTLFGSPEDPSPLAKSMWADHKGMDPAELDAKGFEEMKSEYLQMVRAGYDETTRAVQWRQYGGSGSKKAPLPPAQNIRLMVQDGQPLGPQGPSLPGSSGAGYSFSISEQPTMILGNKQAFVSSLDLTDTGDIIAYARVKKVNKDNELAQAQSADPMSSFYETVEIRNPHDVSEVARSLGFKDMDDLKAELQRKVQQHGGTRPTTGTQQGNTGTPKSGNASRFNPKK